MKSTNNFIFITLEKEFNDKIAGPEGKLELDLMSFKDTIVDEKDQVIYNVHEKRLNFGTVIAVPERLTSDQNILMEDPGKPEPSRYIGHDHVIQAPEFLQYDPGTYVAKWKTTADIEPEVEVGDKIYFHFNTISPENKYQLPDGRTFYKLAYENALCVVQKAYAINLTGLENLFPGRDLKEVLDEFFKDKESFIIKYKVKDQIIDGHQIFQRLDDYILPIGGNVFIEPSYDDDAVDIGTGGMKGKISASGIVTEIGIRPKALRGIVRHVGKPLKGQRCEVKPSDQIVYQKHSDWTVKVEGIDYYCMKQWDIEGILND